MVCFDLFLYTKAYCVVFSRVLVRLLLCCKLQFCKTPCSILSSLFLGHNGRLLLLYIFSYDFVNMVLGPYVVFVCCVIIMGNDMYIWNNAIYLAWGMENTYGKAVVHIQGMSSHFSFQKSRDIELVYQKLKGN